MEDILYDEDPTPRNEILSTKKDEAKYPVFTEDGKIICQVCGKSFKMLTQSHTLMHGFSPKSYKEKFGTPLFAESSKRKISTSLKARNISLFKNQENKPAIPELELLDDDSVPDIQDLKELPEPINKKKDPSFAKTDIACFLETIFSGRDAKENYFIEEYSGSGAFPGTTHLKYSFITDITIPSLKLAFFFPDTFWHNREAALDPNKYSKLSEDGWKSIIVKGSAPSHDQIKQELRKSNLI